MRRILTILAGLLLAGTLSGGREYPVVQAADSGQEFGTEPETPNHPAIPV